MEIVQGLILVCLSGAMAGLFLTPAKFMKAYRFENYWLVQSLVGCLFIPWLLAYLVLPDLPAFLSSLTWQAMLTPGLFALSWGVASMLSGLSVGRIGLSLTYALVIGVGAAAGVMVPLLYFTPESLGTRSGQLILAGIALMAVGLVLVTRAGRLRESASASANADSGSKFWLGIGMATFAGFLSAGLNFSFAFSGDVIHAAEVAGASGSSATYPVWALALLGGMIPNAGFSAWNLTRNRTWRLYPSGIPKELLLAVLMGTLFIGSTAVYGLGASMLGPLGTSAGWGIMQTMQIVVGNAGGFVTGEWKDAGPRPRQFLLAGLALLVVASAVMALGNRT